MASAGIAARERVSDVAQPPPAASRQYALGDARSPFDLYASSPLSLERTAEERAQLKALVEAFPPKTDGFLFRTEAEVNAVVALHQALRDLHATCSWASLNVHDTRTLLCFARARRLDVKAAEAMWRAAYAWRKSYEPERALKGYLLPAVLDQFGTGGQFGLDREGSPIMLDNLGQIDPVSLLRNISDFEIVESEICKLEKLQALVDLRVVETGKLHHGCTVIIDLKHLGAQHLNSKGLHVLKLILENNDANYPERAKRVLVVNAPFIFGVIWKIVQLFLDPVTREKVQIFSGIPHDVLLKYIADDQLAVEYGGKAAWPPTVRRGGVVPKDWADEFHDVAYY